jgi:hypothetical protein
MERRAILLAAMAWVMAPSAASADDALIDGGTSLTYLHISTSGTGGKTLSVMGATARFLYMDGRGEVGMGGKITAFAPAWGDDTDNLGFDLQFTAQFSGRWKGEKAHIMPCGGFSVGFRQLFLDTRVPARYAVSGFGIDLHLGVHGYFGRSGGFYWRLSGLLNGHLLFPDPGWTGGAGVELTIGIYID